MSKCHVKELRKVWSCILADAGHAFPGLKIGFEKDLIRLERLVEARGIRVFLLDLPAVGKHLDRCLSNGEYNPPRIPLTKRVSGGVMTPKFLGGLYLLVFNEDGRLQDHPDIEAIFFLRQLTLFAKKYTIDCPASAITTTVVEMVQHDDSLPEPSRFWSDKDAEFSVAETRFISAMPLNKNSESDDHRVFLANLDKVSRLVSSTLGSYDPYEWRCKHGPGAIADQIGPSNKYCWSNWSDRLERVFPIADFGYHSHSSWVRDATSDVEHCGRTAYVRHPIGSTEPDSRLLAVPKSFAGPRLIAAEPSEHMWCQQSLLSYLCTRVGESWIGDFIAFRDQSTNQRLCLEGSTSGALATIDLSMASDCVTPALVGCLFRTRPELLAAFKATRTLAVSQQITNVVSERIVLKKFSTMGNAYTFPVESLAFLSISIAAILTDRGEDVTLASVKDLVGQVSVFGDDIIVPTDSRESVCRALELLWFKVNSDKSFWNGKFRESCGVDSFMGHDVTPVYYRQFYDGTPKSLSSVIETTNRYYNRYLLNVSGYLESTLPRNVLRVAYGSGSVGLSTRGPLDNDHIKVRYNIGLQRQELRALQILSVVEKCKTDGDYALLQYFTERPSPDSAWEHGYVRRTRVKTRVSWIGADLLLAQGKNRFPTCVPG